MDVVITDYGIAINPRRQDLIECMKDVDLPFMHHRRAAGQGLRHGRRTGSGAALRIRIVGVIEARDGTVIDVVRQRKEFEF